MARRLEGRTFNVSVIGLSGTEKEKGQYGVGKSCLCNRFLNQEADGFYHEHISVLSQSDFAGRVINNNHFLYWGSVVKTDDGNNFTFQVVEQTEFIDDVSFSPFKTARTETYTKRAIQPRVTSAEKLMYICKDQLGMETDSAYPQVVMPEGKLLMDGFLCCFDVSKVPQRVIEKQVEFVAALLNNILKLKKPVVLATTKGDSSCPEYVKEAEKLLNRKEFKGSIPLVETSAHENINTEAAFMLLAHLIDKTKVRTKILPFAEARRQRHEVLKVAKEAYLNLLRNIVSDSKSMWNAYRRKLEPHSDFVHYVELFGSDQAKKEFRAHTKRLRDEHIRLKENRYLKTLPQLLKHYIPALECLPERGWNTVRRVVREHPDFDHHFVMVEGEEGCYSWKQVDSFLDDPEEVRIPFDLLNSAQAEMCFCDHLNELQAQHRRIEMQREFKLLLEENPQVLPGKLLSDTYVYFVGKDCYNNLDEADRNHVYDIHMEELRHAARKDFLELLWEKSHVFWGVNTSAKLTHQDLQSITTALQDDNRYKMLDHLDENRRVMILNHLGFIQSPSRERCGYQDLCIDTQVENLLASMAVRPDLKESSSDSIDSGCKTLNLVLLGKDGLAINLNKDIRNLCVDDEYQLDGNLYSLDYRPIDGDVSREQNALSTANFKPHGCLCVYNSEETLDYIQESLERSLTNDVVSEGENTLMGMPIVIIQAAPPSSSTTTSTTSTSSSSSTSSPPYGHRRQHSSSHIPPPQQPPPQPPQQPSPLSSPLNSRELLREKGKAVAARLHGEFISCPASLDESVLFSHSQIHKALETVIHACNPGLNGWYLSDQFEPDIRLSMCLMCGDPFPIQLPLGPLLNHEMCRVLADTPYCITLDLILESSKQKVEIEVSSYHGGNRLHEGTFHGHILVYSTKRKASLATLRAYSETLLRVPKLILAVSDSCGTPSSFFNSDLCQTLVQEGNQLADKMGANFMTTTANFPQQTAVFLPFFRTVWDLREESESQYQDTIEEPPLGIPTYEEKAYYGSRPPAPLPKTYNNSTYHTNKSTTSNSTDSDPVYDQPNLFHTHYSDSDHEGDRGSSTSPPPPHSQHHHHHHHHHQPPILHHPSKGKGVGGEEGDGDEEELYSEVTIPNGDRLVKAQKNEYAGWPDSNHHPHHHHDRYGLYSSTSVTHDYDRKKYVPNARSMSQSQYDQVTAPLAKPEAIEIADYCHVKDAVPIPLPGDSDYQIVEDALPPGHLHRVTSVKPSSKIKERVESEDSDGSSLEGREKHKFSKRSGPNRRKSKHRHDKLQQSQGPIYASPNKASSKWKNLPHAGKMHVGEANSQSEDNSEGTYDSGLPSSTKLERKRRSFNQRRWRIPSSSLAHHRTSSPITDLDKSRIIPIVQSYDDMAFSPTPIHHFQTLPLHMGGVGHTAAGEEGDCEDLNDSGTWSSKWLKSLRAPDKQRRKDERRRQKEEEKKVKEAQKKLKKKDPKLSVTSAGSFALEEFPTAPENSAIPLFVYKCVCYIDAEGLQTEGLYRIPGNKSQGELFLSKFVEDPNTDIDSLSISVNAIATLIKNFFNELSEPLIPSNVRDELMEAAEMGDKSGRLLMLRGVIKKLPDQNYELLKYIMTHLFRVAQNQEHNSMSSSNLAKCWWPTLLRLEFKSYEKMIQGTQIPEDIVHALIEQAQFFFYGGNEV